MKIPKLLRSSKNPENVSLSYKGLLFMVAVAVLNYFNVVVDKGLLMDIINASIIFVSSAITLHGFVRKFK